MQGFTLEKRKGGNYSPGKGKQDGTFLGGTQEVRLILSTGGVETQIWQTARSRGRGVGKGVPSKRKWKRKRGACR